MIKKAKMTKTAAPQFAINDIVEYHYDYDVDRGGHSSYKTQVARIVMIEGDQAVVRAQFDRNSTKTTLVAINLARLQPVRV